MNEPTRSPQPLEGRTKMLLLLAALAFPLIVLLAQPGPPESVPPARFGPDDVLLVAAARGGPAGAEPTAGVARQHQVSITIEGDYRLIHANGLPNHPTGQFPNRGNPNRISPQTYRFRVPLNPQAAATPTPLGMHPFGVAVNGIVFDPGAAEWWRGDRQSGWQYEPLGGGVNLGVDQNNAHVQPTGAYHYHGLPIGLLEHLTGGRPQMVLVGWAADGFPMYGPWGHRNPQNTRSPMVKLKSSYRVKPGLRPGGPGGTYDGTFIADYEFVKGAGDLDECNGRFGITPEFPRGTYHYVLTEDFPFIPRLFKGTPDSSFFRGPGGRRGPGGPPGPGRGPGGPRNQGDARNFGAPDDGPPGEFRRPPPHREHGGRPGHDFGHLPPRPPFHPRPPFMPNDSDHPGPGRHDPPEGRLHHPGWPPPHVGVWPPPRNDGGTSMQPPAR